MTRLRPLPASRLVEVPFPDVHSDDLVYFVLNVGDGDCQLLLLPAGRDGHRRALIVDVASAPKMLALIRKLRSVELLGEPGGPQRPFPLVVGTHPHDDHIGGMPRLLRELRGQVDEYWHPGYYIGKKSFVNTMNELAADADHPRPALGLPTSGTVRVYDSVAVTVLAPSISLRSRFDTYGVDINDSSISLMVEYPVSRAVQPAAAHEPRRSLPRRTNRRLLLGADAQHASWAHVTVDFPALRPSEAAIGRQLAERGVLDQLRADVFKVPHHASKHGVVLELVERVAPTLSVVSSVYGGGSYLFPHDLAMDALREASQPVAGTGDPRESDWDLGIHVTGASDDAGVCLGSMAIVVPLRGKIRLIRFGDRPTEQVDFGRARQWQ